MSPVYGGYQTLVVTVKLGTSLFEKWTPNCTAGDYGHQFFGHDVDGGPFC